MGQTQQTMGSSPLAMANQMGNQMGQGQVWRGPGLPPPPPGAMMPQPALGNYGTQQQQLLGQMGGAQPMTPQQQQLLGQMGAQGLPQAGDRVAKMQQNLSAIQGMQPNQIPRMPGMQPPPGAPGQGPGGAKAPGTPGGAQQMKQQMARLPGGPRPGAPAQGPGAGKAPGRAMPQMRQQIAQLQGAPGR